ncbi:replication factor A protein, partial [Trifolium medium]|nr:replication factor A protein [Trifolium medium]
MAAAFDFLCDVVPGKTSWRFKVNSVEMVLVDSKGGKIQATIRKQLLYLFRNKLEEGVVYVLSFFTTAPSTGAYRSTLHPFRLVFQMRTKVELSEGPEISRYGFSFTPISEVCAFPSDYDFLVDVIGVLTGMSAEREYLWERTVTKMIVIKLTDQSGKCECALFGDYVEDFKKMLA